MDVNDQRHSCLAVGIGYRAALDAWTRAHLDCFDVLEITVDDCICGGEERRSPIFDLVGQIPLTAHGIGLSIGTDVPLDLAYLDKVAAIVERLRAPAYSEHLAFTRTPGRDLANAEIARNKLDQARAGGNRDFPASCRLVRDIVATAVPSCASDRDRAEWIGVVEAVMALASSCRSLDGLVAKIGGQSASLRQAPENAVVLSTIHSAKGLEWEATRGTTLGQSRHALTKLSRSKEVKAALRSVL